MNIPVKLLAVNGHVSDMVLTPSALFDVTVALAFDNSDPSSTACDLAFPHSLAEFPRAPGLSLRVRPRVLSTPTAGFDGAAAANDSIISNSSSLFSSPLRRPTPADAAVLTNNTAAHATPQSAFKSVPGLAGGSTSPPSATAVTNSLHALSVGQSTWVKGNEAVLDHPAFALPEYTIAASDIAKGIVRCACRVPYCESCLTQSLLLCFDVYVCDPPPEVADIIGHLVFNLPLVKPILLNVSRPVTVERPLVAAPASAVIASSSVSSSSPPAGTRHPRGRHALVSISVQCRGDHTAVLRAITVDPATLHSGSQPTNLPAVPGSLPRHPVLEDGHAVRVEATLQNPVTLPLSLRPQEEVSFVFRLELSVSQDSGSWAPVDPAVHRLKHVWAMALVEYSVLASAATDLDPVLSEPAFVSWQA